MTETRIHQQLQEIKEFKFTGNIVRLNKYTLNKVYAEGREIKRTQELRKWTSKFIRKIY